VNDKNLQPHAGQERIPRHRHLKNWERWDRLHEIKVKTLTIGAQYDEMDPKT